MKNIFSVLALFVGFMNCALALPYVLVSYPDNEEKKFVFSSNPLIIPTNDPSIECKLVDLGKSETGSMIYQLGCKSGEILVRTNVACRKKGAPNLEGNFFFNLRDKTYHLTGMCQ